MNNTDMADLCGVQGAGEDTDDAKVATPPCPSPLSCPAADNNTLYTLHSTLYTLHSNLHVQCHNKTLHAASLMLEVSSSPGPARSTGQQCEDRQRIHNLTVIGDGILSTRMPRPPTPTPQTGNTGTVHNNIGYWPVQENY